MVKAVAHPTKKRSRIAGEILEGLTVLRDAARAGPLEHRFTVRTVRLVIAPPLLGAREIRSLRMRLSASQAVFAAVLGVSADTVQSWEQGRRMPGESVLRMMHLFKEDPRLFIKQIQMEPVSN